MAEWLCGVRKENWVSPEVEDERMCSRAQDSPSSFIQKTFLKYLQNVRYLIYTDITKTESVTQKWLQCSIRYTQLKEKYGEKIIEVLWSSREKTYDNFLSGNGAIL